MIIKKILDYFTTHDIVGLVKKKIRLLLRILGVITTLLLFLSGVFLTFRGHTLVGPIMFFLSLVILLIAMSIREQHENEGKQSN